MAALSPFSATTARTGSWTSCSPTSRTSGTSTAKLQVREMLSDGTDRCHAMLTPTSSSSEQRTSKSGQGPTLAPATQRSYCSAAMCLAICLQHLVKAHWGCNTSCTPDMLMRPADPTGLMLNGWAQQFDVIAASHAFRPLTKRKAKIMWRGRASDEPRDEVRCCLSNRLLAWWPGKQRLALMTVTGQAHACLASGPRSVAPQSTA